MNERWFNRFVLDHLNVQRGIPATAGELAEAAQARLHKPCATQVERAIEYGLSALYLERCEATAADEPLYKLTACGIRQILKQVSAAALDPLIHGC